MKTFAIKVLVNGVALWVAALVVSGIHLGEDADQLSTRLLTILLVAVIFGVVNAVVKPVAKFFAFPFILLTLGLFTFVVNAFMLQLTEWVAGGLNLDFSIGRFFWDAILGSVVITFVSLLLNALLPSSDD